MLTLSLESLSLDIKCAPIPVTIISLIFKKIIFWGGFRGYLCIVLSFVTRCTEKSRDRNLEFAPLGCLALTDEVKLSPHYPISRPQAGFGG